MIRSINKSGREVVYLGMIPTNEVVKVDALDFEAIMHFIGRGFVHVTKQAYQMYQKFGNTIQIFKPTKHAGVTIYSHVFYSAETINKLKTS